MKKLLALVLALVLCLSMFAFNATAEEEAITLRLFASDNQKPDDQLVSDALSEMIQEKLGFGIELVFQPQGEFAQKFPLLIASDEPMDLIYTSNTYNYPLYARSGAFLDLTDLLPDYPALVEVVNPALWEGSKIDGRNYCVPTNKEVPCCSAFYCDGAFLDQLGVDPASIKKFEDIEVVLEHCAENGRYGMQTTVNNHFPTLWRLYYGVPMDTCSPVFMYFDNPGTFVNWYASDEYMEWAKLMNDWYAKGYIIEDIVTADNPYVLKDEAGNYNGKYGVGCVSYSPLNEVGQSKGVEGGRIPMIVTPIVNTTSNCVGSTWAILSKSEHPTEGLELLQAWNTDPEIKNMMTYGIEGVHYNLVDGKVEQVANIGELYTNQNWKTGNMLISYLMVGEPDDKWDQYIAFNESAIDCPHLGFNPDTEEINDKIAAINGVIAEFVPLLDVGVLDAEEYVPQLIDNLNSVGIDEVIDWYQAKYDEWVAAK